MQTTESLKEKRNLKRLEKVRHSKEYIQNQYQIDCIKKVLIEHSDVPPTLLDWLTQSIQNNVILEFKATND